MSERHQVVFLFDVDNTLLDNDRIQDDLKKHLEVIVIGIVLITTLPVLYKMFFGKKPSSHPEDL